MQHTFKTTIELDVTIIAHVSPAMPARPSMNPDSPAYSDPGDPGERSIEAIYLTDSRTGRKIDITDCLTQAELDNLADEAYNDAAGADA